MNADLPCVGYGTFIYKNKSFKHHIKVLGVCKIPNYIRIYHRKLGYWFPFILKRNNHEFKGILFEVVNKDFINKLDIYEGVPELYTRKKCDVIFNSKSIKCWIYFPTKNTLDTIYSKIEKLNSEEKRALYENDLWLEHLKSKYPKIITKYPELFTPIEKS